MAERKSRPQGAASADRTPIKSEISISDSAVGWAPWDELTEIAKACRAKATLLRELDMPDVLAQVDDVLEESA